MKHLGLAIINFLAIEKKGKELYFRAKEIFKPVNIFHKNIYRITFLLSTHCKTYCFAIQKRLFCTVKA